MGYFFEPDDIQLRKQDARVDENLGSPDLPPAGFFDGVSGSIVDGVVSGIAQMEGSATKAVDTVAGYYIQKYDDFFGTYNRKLLTEHADAQFAVARNYTPDPKTTGTAGQIVSTLLRVGLQAAAGAVVGGPFGAAAAVGTTQGFSEYDNLINEGVDKTTAQNMALLSGTINAFGVSIPMSLGFKKAAVDIAGSTLANMGIGMGYRGTAHKILDEAGYSEMAEQYKILDGQSILIDAGLGIVFSGMGYMRASRIRRDQAFLDGLLELNNVVHAEYDSAPGIPTNPISRDAHIKALNEKINAISEGRTVDVSSILEGAEFIPKDLTEFNRQIIDSVNEYYPDLPMGTVQKAVDHIDYSAYTPVENIKPDDILSFDFDSHVVNQAIKNNPELNINTLSDNGEPIQIKASELIEQINKEITNAEHDAKLYDVAAACMFRS